VKDHDAGSVNLHIPLFALPLVVASSPPAEFFFSHRLEYATDRLSHVQT